ncbi:sucrose-phosphate phosphatase [Tumidithrix elongata RA019]|uniref:sucrose-phosphate phosphatase n=1 Tax=Tumidithrix elongata BACA0141 TaxID=2716417 RepID=A0AAW9PW19_9CYAN|nr:sucrose-phosphate phosphatase [Tumidithrix elongata RA019]
MRFLLVTDLDNALIGDNRATIALYQKLIPYRKRFCLIYATGRSMLSVKDLTRSFQKMTGDWLLEPDYLITGVGSEIYGQDGLDREWAERLTKNWQRTAIANLLKSFPDLSLQPPSEQNLWKLSYYVESSHNAAAVESIRNLLTNVGLPAQIAFSSNRDLDILPVNGGKGNAVNYLRSKLELSIDATLVCGSSGNDISLFEQQTLGVMLSNSQKELLDWHQSHRLSQHYLARSPYGWGIIEALDHFKMLAYM